MTRTPHMAVARLNPDSSLATRVGSGGTTLPEVLTHGVQLTRGAQIELAMKLAPSAGLQGPEAAEATSKEET